jgi:hypothetical protein
MHDDANITERPDPRIARTEWKLRILEKISERGVDIIDAVADRACADAKAPPESPKGRDPIDAYARVSRAVRFNLVLDTMLADYLAALVAGDLTVEFWPRRARQDPRSGDPCKREASSEPDRKARRDQLHGHVTELADPDSYDEDERERIYDALHENLYESERYDVFLDLPLEEAVEAICKDLGVRPQYERWEGINWPPWRPNRGPPGPHDPAPQPDPAPPPGPAPPEIPAIILHDHDPASG